MFKMSTKKFGPIQAGLYSLSINVLLQLGRFFVVFCSRPVEGATHGLAGEAGMTVTAPTNEARAYRGHVSVECSESQRVS